MAKKIKTNYEIKKNRLQRRLAGSMRDVLAGVCLLSAAVAIVMVFIYAYSYVLSMPYFQIKEIAVRGLAELTEKDVLALAGVKPHQNLLAVNTDVLERKISVNPWVEKAYVGREFPNRLVLVVKERKPLALVKQASDFYLIDAGGVVFKKMSRGDDPDLPVITGASWKGKTPSRFLPGALGLIAKLSGSSQYAYLGAISEININDMFGLSLLTDSGLHLKLGIDNFEDKLKQVRIVMEDMEKRGLGGSHLSIDLCDTEKITVQRKNAVGRTQPGAKSRKYKT